MNLMNRLENAIQEAPPERHSYFQLKHFIIGKELTVQGRMWQCLREIKSRHAAIKSLNEEIEETKDRILLLDIEKERNGLALGEYLAIEKREQQRRLAVEEQEIKNRQFDRQRMHLEESRQELELRLQGAQDEAEFFLDSLEALKQSESLKPMDDIGSQEEYWQEKLSSEVHLRLLLGRGLDPDLVRTVLSLHEDSPIKKQIRTMLEVNKENLVIQQSTRTDARTLEQS